MQIISQTGNWYKGNLHTHTTVSDGQVTPLEACRQYKAAGYDFLALTDHDITSDGGFCEGLLLLRGTELAMNFDKPRVAYHFVGIGGSENLAAFDYNAAGNDPQRMIDHLKSCGAYTILCHPDWSLMTADHILALHGYDAVEVMNAVSDPYARGDSSHTIDAVMAAGRADKLVATDDAHFYNGEQCWSSIWVNAEALTEDAILAAIRAGNYYASEGPRFRALSVDDGVIRVSTTPVKLIRFMSDSFYAPDRRCITDCRANQGEYRIKPSDTYVRVEAVDANGRRVWSQYIDVQGMAK